MAGMHIKPSHEGLFTAKANAAGKGVQEYAREEANDPDASPATRKQANFARMAKRGWKPLNRKGKLRRAFGK